MRTLLLVTLAASFSVLTGCTATPAYSGKERSRMISRNWDYQYRQMADDVDHVLLLRGDGNLTIWHVQASD